MNKYLKMYPEHFRNIGLNITYYRLSRGLTQDQLGDLLNIDQSHISRIENATIGISLGMLFTIAKVLNVEPYKLLQSKE